MNDLLERLRVLGDQARAFAVRHRLGWRHGAATAGVLVAGIAVMAMARDGSSEARAVADPARRLKIEVVQPVEPVFTSGPVMEVGTLVDGFDPGMLRETAMVGPDPLPVDSYADKPGEQGGFFRRFSSAIQQALPQREERPAPRIRREDRSYGFDGPRPDWQAEREARRAWRDRIEAERRAEREMRDRYQRELYERDRYEADRRDRREMRQRMEEPPPYEDADGEPVG